jgi:Fic family protein
MNTPNYNITNLILHYIVRYELAVKDITNTHLPGEYFEKTYERYKAGEIDQLGELIGYPIGYNKALTAQRGQIMPSEKDKYRIFSNFRSINDYIRNYSSRSAIKPSMEMAVHLNKLLLKGIVDEWDLGKLRTFSDKPNEIYDTWYKYRDFYPHVKANTYFNDLIHSMINDKTKTHKLIQLGILLYEFIDKAPFLTGNQMTAILTISTLAKDFGYNPYNLIPWASTINMVNEDLISAFKIAKSKRNITIFLEAFLYTISLSAIEISQNVDKTYNNKVKNHSKLREELNQRQIKAMDYLEEFPKITRGEYTKMMGISFMTSYRDLQELIDKGYIKSKGSGRGSYYVKAEQKVENKKKDIEVF